MARKEKTIEELVRAQDIYGRLALFAGSAFAVVASVALVSLVVSSNKVLEGVQQQLAQQKTLLEQQQSSTEELKRYTADQLTKQTRYILCLADFFAQKNRATLILTDIESCAKEQTPQASVQSTPVLGAQSQPIARTPQPSPVAPVTKEPTTSSPGPEPQPEPSKPSTPQPTLRDRVLTLPQRLLTGLVDRL